MAHISGRDRWWMRPTDMPPVCPTVGPVCRRALRRWDHLLWIWVLEWDGEGVGGRGGCINYRNGHTLGCYKRSACVMKGFSTCLNVSSHWMGNFQFSGLAHFMESLWSYSLFSVCAVYFCFLFFWPACLRSTWYLLLGIKLFVVWFLQKISSDMFHCTLFATAILFTYANTWQILPTLITGNNSAIRFS